MSLTCSRSALERVYALCYASFFGESADRLFSVGFVEHLFPALNVGKAFHSVHQKHALHVECLAN